MSHLSEIIWFLAQAWNLREIKKLSWVEPLQKAPKMMEKFNRTKDFIEKAGEVQMKLGVINFGTGSVEVPIVNLYRLMSY